VTVGIYVAAFRFVVDNMSLPRALITKHPFGRPIGPANHPQRHAAVVEAALSLAESADVGPAVAEMPGAFAG